ncbi:MAG: flagellar assembly protein FliW [Bacillota bacterium]
MMVETTRFGTLEVLPGHVLTFPEGLLGFEDCHRFVLIEKGGSKFFRWLQSLDRPELAFVVVDPRRAVPGYEPVVTRWELDSVKLRSAAGAVLLAIVVVPPDVRKMTANLQAPIIVNPETMEARQVISTGPDHVIRQPIFDLFNGAPVRKTG